MKLSQLMFPLLASAAPLVQQSSRCDKPLIKDLGDQVIIADKQMLRAVEDCVRGGDSGSKINSLTSILDNNELPQNQEQGIMHRLYATIQKSEQIRVQRKQAQDQCPKTSDWAVDAQQLKQAVQTSIRLLAPSYSNPIQAFRCYKESKSLIKKVQKELSSKSETDKTKAFTAVVIHPKRITPSKGKKTRGRRKSEL